MIGTGLTDLVARAYEAACDPAGLQVFIRETAGYFAADSAAYMVWPNARPAAMLQISHGLAPAELHGLLGSDQAPASLLRALTVAPAGAIFDDPASDGTPGFIMAGVVEADEHNRCALLLRRSPGREPFHPSDQGSLTALMHYLRRATGINTRFIRVFSDHQVARLIMDGAPAGILIFGQAGQCIYANTEARRIIDEAVGITMLGNRIEIDDVATCQSVKSFLQQARSSGEDPADGTPPGVLGLSVPRGAQRSACQLILYGLPFKPSQANLDPDHSLAMGMLHDPDTGKLPSDELLGIFFGLTPAEAHIAQALCRGLSLQSVADELSISVNTARTHLRNIFSKVGVHSQHALVQRVSQSLYISETVRQVHAD